MPLLSDAGLGCVLMWGEVTVFESVFSSTSKLDRIPIKLLSLLYLKYARLNLAMAPNQMSDDNSLTNTNAAVQEALPKVAEPPKFAVMLHNDDYTTMEYVVEVLTIDFSKPSEEAMALMLKVHEEGKAVAGIYSFDIAETKVAIVTEKSRKAGFPLKLTLEPVGK
jgi:ATP-dependent Clp protease adaptor protein ClpS